MIYKVLTFSFFSLFGACLYAKSITLAYVDFPPYEFEKNGKAHGILVEIVQKVFKEANIPLKLRFRPFKRALNSTKQGKIDGLFNFFKTEERLKSFDYSEPIIKNPLVYFVRKKSTLKITKLKDLKGLNVGVMLGYTYGVDFDNSTLFTKDKGTSHVGNLKKLVFKRIEIYPCDKLVCMYIALENHLFSTLKVLPTPLKVMNGHIGFTKGKHLKVIRKINKTLSLMHREGEIKRIISQYIEKM